MSHLQTWEMKGNPSEQIDTLNFNSLTPLKKSVDNTQKFQEVSDKYDEALKTSRHDKEFKKETG